jgi:hypothetical protein
MMKWETQWVRTGLCWACGRPTSEHVHEACGVKRIDDNTRRPDGRTESQHARKEYRFTQWKYQHDVLPAWMFRGYCRVSKNYNHPVPLDFSS